jgi:hypothetical protein
MQVLPLVSFWLKHGGELSSLQGDPRRVQLALEVLRTLAPLVKHEWPSHTAMFDDLLTALTEAFAES